MFVRENAGTEVDWNKLWRWILVGPFIRKVHLSEPVHLFIIPHCLPYLHLKSLSKLSEHLLSYIPDTSE